MPEKVLDCWRAVVESYSACDLTCAGDKLPALAGIVNFFQQATGDRCLAGAWKSRLPSTLAWQVLDPRRRRPRPDGSCRAPSWSWASLDGPIRWIYTDSDSLFQASVVAVDDHDDNSTVLSLTLTGRLFRSDIVLHADQEHSLRPDALGIAMGDTRPFYLVPLLVAPNAKSTERLSVHFFLLEPILCTTPVAYRRVGTCQQDVVMGMFGYRRTAETQEVCNVFPAEEIVVM